MNVIVANKDVSNSNVPAVSGEERREWQRVLVDIEVDYGNEENFLFAYIRDISATGIFVRTNTPEPAGTHLNLRFDAGGEMIQLEGKVIWINAYRPGQPDNLHPGMGIQFTDLSNQQRRMLAHLIKCFAYLENPED